MASIPGLLNAYKIILIEIGVTAITEGGAVYYASISKPSDRVIKRTGQGQGAGRILRISDAFLRFHVFGTFG